MTAVARLELTALDCADPAPLAAFWAALLAGTVILEREGLSVVKTDSTTHGACSWTQRATRSA